MARSAGRRDAGVTAGIVQRNHCKVLLIFSAIRRVQPGLFPAMGNRCRSGLAGIPRTKVSRRVARQTSKSVACKSEGGASAFVKARLLMQEPALQTLAATSDGLEKSKTTKWLGFHFH
jgi:hypothetical protein